MNVNLAEGGRGVLMIMKEGVLRMSQKGMTSIDASLVSRLAEARDGFIETGNCDESIVDEEVLRSWQISREYQAPYDSMPAIPLTPNAKYHPMIAKNKAVVETAQNFIDVLARFIPDQGYIVYLADNDGMILYCYSNDSLLATYSHALRLSVGMVWNEHTCGTIGHILSCRTMRALIMLSAENYNHLPADTPMAIWWNRRLTISAPIYLDDSKQFFCTLNVIVAEKTENLLPLWGAFVTTVWHITYEVGHRFRLNLVYQALESTKIALIDLDLEGRFVKCNEKGKDFLCTLMDCNDIQAILGLKAEELFGHNKFFESILETKTAIYDREIVFTDRGRSILFNAIIPAVNIVGDQYGYILSINPDKNKHARQGTSVPVVTGFDSIVGDSLSTRKTIVMAEKVSTNTSNILLTGESGVGKEVYAKAIHSGSRAGKPFIAVNCAAIPPSLIASEFFGYERGSFTGADRQGRAGKIEQANGGTLFLDEIGDMPLELQTTLLRVLEDRKVMRVGGSNSIPVDFRLICATNKDIEKMIERNAFRDDLYYRIAVFTITIPPLRNRIDDIIPLAEFFLAQQASLADVTPPELDHLAKSALLKYTWPGNIRQLKNVMEYAFCMAEKNIIFIDNLPDNLQRVFGSRDAEKSAKAQKLHTEPSRHAIKKKGAANDDRKTSLKEMEKEAISQALLLCGNHIGQAAEILGVSKSTLYRKVRAYRLLDY